MLFLLTTFYRLVTGDSESLSFKLVSVRQDSNPGASIIDYNPLDQHCPRELGDDGNILCPEWQSLAACDCCVLEMLVAEELKF